VKPSVHRAEAFVGLVAFGIAALFLWDSRRYPPSPFEPIGSGAIPGGVAAIVLALAALTLAFALRGFRLNSEVTEEPELGVRVMGLFVLTVAYTLVLASGLVRYAFATAPYFILGVVVIAERPKPLLKWAVPLAFFLAFSLDFAFRRIFIVNIP
jgi:hypothetical protein